MAPLLVPLLLFPFFLSFSQDVTPRAEMVIGRRVPQVELLLETGERIRLDRVAGGRVLLLSFIYTRCSSACPMIVRGIEGALKSLKGEEPVVLLIDFDERDTVEDLREFRVRRGVPEGWKLALAKGEDLRLLTSFLDFKFFYDEKTDMFAHPGVLVVLTPDMRVSAYFLGVTHSGRKLAEAVERASLGRVSLNPVKGFLFKCFRYDPVTGTYEIDWSFVAMLLGGLIPLGGMFYFIVLRELVSLLRKYRAKKSEEVLNHETAEVCDGGAIPRSSPQRLLGGGSEAHPRGDEKGVKDLLRQVCWMPWYAQKGCYRTSPHPGRNEEEGT